MSPQHDELPSKFLASATRIEWFNGIDVVVLKGNSASERSEFPASGCGQSRALHEGFTKALNAVACAIRDRKSWSQNIADAAISANWFQEAVQQAAAIGWAEQQVPDRNAPYDPDDGDDDVVGDGADEEDEEDEIEEEDDDDDEEEDSDVLSTLQEWAASNPGPVSLGAVFGTYVADDYVPDTLHDALASGVSALENTLFHDWPGEQVLDLVDPSLYCLVYGVSRRVAHQAPYTSNLFLVRNAHEKGTVIQPDKKRQAWFSSEQFQWLPSEFAIDQGGKVTIESYINNLHPHNHSQLYHTIADIFALFVPLFNRALTQMLMQSRTGYVVRIVPPPPVAKRVVDLKGRRVQVIVKLANIHLTPASPSYPGGSWHVEGMADENIVASGIYYYSQDNVTDSGLAFRTDICDPNDPSHMDSDDMMNKYGMSNGEPLTQLLGRVTALPGRCLCFPNIYQHQVQPFQLADPSRPGHRKVLVFFLVNPWTRITSTADVPPQRLDWLLDHEFHGLLNNYSLPMETKEVLIRYLNDQPQEEDAPPPFTLARAKLHREQLMEERRKAEIQQNEEIFELPFSL